jgi:hypothetical protein
MLESFLFLALIVVAAWRWLRQPSTAAWASGPLADVGDAPADAEPMFRPRLDDNGLGTYTMVVPGLGRHRAEGRRPRDGSAPPTGD